MLTLSPPLFPSFAWPLEEYPLTLSQQEQNSLCKDFSLETSDSLLPSPQSSSMPQAGGSSRGDIINGMARKLNHNASERDRRKKINNLYSSLFSLLPAANHMKKLSIPATVSCAVKYIPELQKEVEKLVEKKEELSSRISRQQDDVQLHHLGKRRKSNGEKCCLSTISVNQVGANEVVIHMSSSLIINNNIKSSLISDTLNSLEEEDGLILLNASSFESPGEMVFHNLYFQAQGNYKTDIEIIRRKVVLLAGEE